MTFPRDKNAHMAVIKQPSLLDGVVGETILLHCLWWRRSPCCCPTAQTCRTHSSRPCNAALFLTSSSMWSLCFAWVFGQDLGVNVGQISFPLDPDISELIETVATICDLDFKSLFTLVFEELLGLLVSELDDLLGEAFFVLLGRVYLQFPHVLHLKFDFKQNFAVVLCMFFGWLFFHCLALTTIRTLVCLSRTSLSHAVFSL